MSVRLVFVLALVIVPAAATAHPSQLYEVKANLDRDRPLERVVGSEDVSSDHRVWRASVRVIDRCRGRNRVHLVIGGYQQLESASPVQADARGPSEAIGVLVGSEGGTGEARLVRLVGSSSRCPALRTLFRYVAAAAEPPTPGLRLTRFRVEMHELETSYPGRELSLVEEFQMPPMLSSVMRVTQYRHNRKRDRYVVYATNTHRVP
jgi:hypothetical protein